MGYKIFKKKINEFKFFLYFQDIYIYKDKKRFDLLHNFNLVSTKIDKCNLELIWENISSCNALRFYFTNLKYLDIGVKRFENVYKKDQLLYRLLNIGFISPDILTDKTEYFENNQNI